MKKWLMYLLAMLTALLYIWSPLNTGLNGLEANILVKTAESIFVPIWFTAAYIILEDEGV